MLDRLKPLLGYHVHASDGLIGTLDDFCFDDSQWMMRYLVVDAEKLLHRHRVIISPMAILGIDWLGKAVALNHSIDQIKNSPDIDVDKPVHRQLEEQLLDYYGWVAHWTPQVGMPEPRSEPVPSGDILLRSMNSVCKYAVMASDGCVGTIDDLVVHHNGWRIPLVILDTRHYLSTIQVVIPAPQIEGIRVEEREITIHMNKADISGSPCFDPTRQLEDYLTTLTCSA